MSIDRETTLERLSKLSVRQREVLSLRCQGLLYKDIAEQLYISESTVKATMGHVYLKLELEYLVTAERSKALFQEFCPALKYGVLPEQPEEEPLEGEIEQVVPPEVEELVDKDEMALVPYQHAPMVEVKPKPIVIPSKPRRRWPSCTIGFLLGILIMALVIWGVSSGLELLPTQETLAPGQNSIQSVGQEGTQEAVIPSQAQSTATETTLPVVTLGTMFYDDFEDGPDPLWEIVYGETGMANGKYTVIGPYSTVLTDHFAIVQGYTWGNINITLELDEYREIFVSQNASRFGAVVIRYNPEGISVGLLIHPEGKGLQFGTLDIEGNWTFHSGSLVKGGEKDFNLKSLPNLIRIEARGNTYHAYINDMEITSATIPGPTTGLVGLWFRINASSQADVSEYAPRFEYIQVESFP